MFTAPIKKALVELYRGSKEVNRYDLDTLTRLEYADERGHITFKGTQKARELLPVERRTDGGRIDGRSNATSTKIPTSALGNSRVNRSG